MTEHEVISLSARFRPLALRYRAVKGFLPASLGVDDLVQEALLLALTHRDKFRADGRACYLTYLHTVIHGRWADMCAQSHFGPSACMRYYRRKKGLPINYGETSLDQGAWSDRIATPESTPAPVHTLAQEHRAEVERHLANFSDLGISYAKTRQKYHVQPRILGREVFLGQFRDLDAARDAKRAFLGSLLSTPIHNIEA